METILKLEEDEPLKGGSANDKYVSEAMSSESPALISVGIQCTPVETDSGQRGNCTPLLCSSPVKCGENVSRQAVENEPVFIKPWPLQIEPSSCHNQKLLVNSGFTKPYPCNLQPFSFDDDIFLQLDYKTRNKIKTKQRRQDPFYRDQERVRQRAVMQLKRQDPCFRAIEREKGRCRMRIKRLDPVFRTQERERQRERMKLKRQDPNFRERERELQKNRIHEKRLNPEFREREKAQDRIRMRLKRSPNSSHNPLVHTFSRLEQNAKMGMNSISQNPLEPYGSVEPAKETQIGRNISLCSDHLGDVKPLILKEGETPLDALHYRTSHVFNFHIYNDGKDAWHNSAEKISKATLLFNMFKDDINQQSSLTTSVNNGGNICTAKSPVDYIGHQTKGCHVNNNSATASSPTKQLCVMSTDPNSSIESSLKDSKRSITSSPSQTSRS